jgi:hypothetical protein
MWCCVSSPRGFTRTTVFDIALEIEGEEFTDFDGLVIREYVDKAGLSGIIHSELSVNIYTDSFSAPDNAEVILKVPGVIVSEAKFYITRREASGRKVSLSCRSKLFCLDTPVDLLETDFDAAGEIDTFTAISRIAAQADLAPFSYMGQTDVLAALPRLKKDFLFGKNALSVLEKISAALCGTFREYQGGLIFIPWEQPFMQAVPAEALSEIKRGFSKTARKLVMTGAGENFVLGSGDYSGTVKLDTPLASESTSGAVSARIFGRVYTPYSCNVKFTSVPCATAVVTIGDEELFTNNIVCYPRAGGIYAKVSCNADTADEWDYSGEVERKIRDKITAGEPVGQLTILRDGQVKFEVGEEYPATSYVYATEEHGFTVDSYRAAVKGNTLSLEEVSEIKLNSEELLTESKELVGALNELFLAAPEGGDSSGAKGFSDISPYLKGYNIWYKAFNLKTANPRFYPAYGVQLAQKTVMTSLPYQLYIQRLSIPTTPLTPIIHYRVKVYGYNPGETAVLIEDIDYSLPKLTWERNYEIREVNLIPINNTEAYEYYLFICPGVTVENFDVVMGYEYPVVNPSNTEMFMQISWMNNKNIQFRYDMFNNMVMNTKMTIACVSTYIDNFPTYGWYYGSTDIDNAIKAYNNGG